MKDWNPLWVIVMFASLLVGAVIDNLEIRDLQARVTKLEATCQTK